MKNEIILALKNSLIGDNATLQESNQKLGEFSKQENYCISLMEIIDDQSFDIPLKQAALIQLKNNIKSKWKPKNEKLQMTANEKNNIRNSLVIAILRCSKNHLLIKLYREVLTTIIGYEYDTWIPLHDILNYLRTGQNIPPLFHCIIAICTNFEFSVVEKQKTIFNEFLKEILPAVLQIVKAVPTPELIYLSLKILWKSIHYQMTNEIKSLTSDWMELLYLTIVDYNEQFQNNLDEYQVKNTPQFYYYHSKKWATRIVMRFIQKHAKIYLYNKINEQNVQYSNYWYQTFGMKLCETIVMQLSKPIPTTKKVRYFQLKSLQGILNDRPELLEQHASLFQYDILLKHMCVTQEDEKLAKNDVVEYLRVDDQSTMTYSNIKKVATEVWNSFLQLKSKIDREHNIYHPGPLFQPSLNFMFKNISSQNLIEKQLGMYLFCENRMTINRVPLIKQKIPEIIGTYVVNQLQNPVLLIRARAFDMFYEYGKDIKDKTILTTAIQSIYKAIIGDQSPLIRIKAATALNPLLSSHSECKQLLKPFLKDILQVYLKLIQKYDLQQIVSSLQYFIGDFSDSIGPYAVDLFRYLTEIFGKMFNKDIQLSQNEQYGSQVELAASGCIKTMTQIVEAPLDANVKLQIQQYVLQICSFLFASQSFDYHQDMFYLLRVHLEKVDKISPKLWFFYQVIIYFLTGIPKELWSQIQNLPLPDANKQILSNIKQGNNLQFLEHAIPVLRNYFGKGYNMIIAQKDDFKKNFINMAFHLVGQVYRKGVNNSELQGEVHLDCSSILLVYLIQSFPQQMTKNVVSDVWNVGKFNLVKGKSIYLKQITCQIICVLLWKHPTTFLELVIKQKYLPGLIKQIKTIGIKLDEYQQKKRVILGICSYLNVSTQSIQTLSQGVKDLSKLLFRLIKKNCYTRIIMNTKQEDLKKKLLQMEDDDDDDDQNENQQEDDEDLWDEQYNQRHVSILKKYNQLSYFKQTIQNLNANCQPIYQLVIQSAKSSKYLQQLNNILQTAINLPQK